MVAVGGGDGPQREMGASVSCGPVHLSQEGGDKQIGAERGVVTFMLVLLSVPVDPGVHGSSVIPALAPPLAAGRGRVHECGSPWAELRLRSVCMWPWSLAQQAP